MSRLNTKLVLFKKCFLGTCYLPIFAMILYGPLKTYGEELSDETVNASVSDAGIQRAKRNNNSYELMVSSLSHSIKPDMFIDESINDQKLNLKGFEVGLGKGFSLGESLYTNFSIRRQVTNNLTGISLDDIDRTSTLTTWISGLSLGVNFLSLKIDHASTHPFLGIYYFKSEFKDSYSHLDETTTINFINSSGYIIDVGVQFTDQYSGLFSTFKFGLMNTLDSNYETLTSNIQGADAAYEMIEEATFGGDEAWYFAVGLGGKF